MSFEMDWSPNFCLACDRQTDGKVYCSEACRLTEYEMSSSKAASPTSSSAHSWSTRKFPSHGFILDPPYNFSNAQPYGVTPSQRVFHAPKTFAPQTSPLTVNTRPALTPSSSQCSLLSLKSTSSATEPNQLSDESRKALRAYASSFDQSRYSRRQST